MSRLLVVVDDQAGRPGLLAEHGLAFWLEHRGCRLLYDTGSGKALLPNMAALGLDPLQLDGVVLSHGHYDHLGGLPGLLAFRQREGQGTEVWCHRGVFAPHWSQRKEGLKDVGAPLGRAQAYQEMGARFHYVSGSAEPWPGVLLLAPIARRSAFERSAPNLVVPGPKGMVSDPLEDDLALLLEGKSGPVVISGCAHAGIINVLAAAAEAAGRPAALFAGGTHLGPSPKAQQDRTVAELARRPGLTVAAGHCTGPEVSKRLAGALPGRFVALTCGVELDL